MLARLLKIRISVIGLTLFAFFTIYLWFATPLKLSPGQLALFSVNSFLFGYYFAPLLSNQKSRVASLITTMRQEEMVILDILTQSHLLSKPARHALKVRLRVYLESVIGNTQIKADNPYYNELLYYTKKAEGEDAAVMNVIYDRVAKTQANRDAMNNLFSSKVYSHEWLVGTVLFGITLFFAMQTDFDHSVFFGLMLAVLCTGLSLLMVILVKFATLTHKEAKRMWVPLSELVANHFDDVTAAEVKAEKARIDEYVQSAQ
jgi:hypothetical protein